MKYYEVFERNNNTNNIIIDISLDDYMDFYHQWDNSKFKKRDINPELVEFFHDCSEQIPMKEGLEIRFHIINEKKDIKKEKEIIESYSNYYKSSIISVKNSIKDMYKVVAISVCLSVIALFLAKTGGNLLTEENLFYSILLEGFDIGGWVFMWEAVYALGFSRIDEKKKYKELKRFLNATISFTYK